MSPLTPRRAAIGIALILLITLPAWVGNPYYINISSQILLFAVFALALNVLVGYAGLVSLGHAGLFATAGYAGALMLQAGYGHFAADGISVGQPNAPNSPCCSSGAAQNHGPSPSTTLPVGLTAASAPTMWPPLVTEDAEPMPPLRSTVVAPSPAPTLPSSKSRLAAPAAA